MRNVLVSLEISVSQEKDKPFICVGKPDYVFQGEFNKDDDKSFSELCDLEYKVETLVRAFKDLGCQAIAIKRETSTLEIL